MISHVGFASPVCKCDVDFINEGIPTLPATTFTRELNRLISLHETLSGSHTMAEDCRLPIIDVDDGVGTVAVLLRYPNGRGADALVYRSADPPRRYAIRITNRRAAITQTARELAFRIIAGDLKGGSHRTYPIREGSMSPVCALRIIVSDFGGNLTLANFLVETQGVEIGRRIAVSHQQVAAIAVRMIEIVRDIHALGMLHADLHGSNVMVGDPNNIIPTLKVIDFGASHPFIDPATGLHIVNRIDVPDWTGRIIFQSPFELEGSRQSRRDDMYRVSEILFRILGGFVDFTDRPAEAAKRKRAWEIDSTVDPVFNEFHYAMCNLDFAERPAYEEWIDRFIATALRTA